MDDDALAQLHASGGSGISTSSSSTPHSRSSAPNLLFAIPLLLLSLSLLSLNRRIFRLKTSSGLSLCGALLGWGIAVSRQGSTFIASTTSVRANDLAIWGITVASAVAAAVLGALVWPLALAGLGTASGASFALSVLLMDDNGLIPSNAGRWAWLAIWSIVMLAAMGFAKTSWRPWIELGASSYTASFLFFLSLDLLINGATGASAGLRYILDTNSYHHSVLRYTAGTVTRVLMVLSWVLAPMAAYAQYCLFPIPQSPPARAAPSWLTRCIEDEPDSDETEEEKDTRRQDAEKDEKVDRTESNSLMTRRVDTMKSNPADIAEPAKAMAMPMANGIMYTPHPHHRSSSSHPITTTQIQRPASYPTRTGTLNGSSSTGGINKAHHRHSSAYPLPSLSQLMAHDDAQSLAMASQALSARQGEDTDAETNADTTTDMRPPLVTLWNSPPSSRSNSRRGSMLTYGRTESGLGKHDEEEQHQQQQGPAQEAQNVEAYESVENAPAEQHGHVGFKHEQEASPQAVTTVPHSPIIVSSSAMEPSRTTSSADVAGISRQHSSSYFDSSDADAAPSSSNTSLSDREAEDASRYGTPLPHLDFNHDEVQAVEKNEKTATAAAGQEVGRTLYLRPQKSSPSGEREQVVYLDSVVSTVAGARGTAIAPAEGTTSVIARITQDGWKTYSNISASRDVSYAFDSKTQWTFDFQSKGSKAEVQELQLAICAIMQAGREQQEIEVWDSNDGLNYTISLAA